MNGAHVSDKNIDAFLDGELSGIDDQIVVDHCAGCPTCREKLERRRALLSAIRSARPKTQAPSHLHQEIAALLQAQQESGDDPARPAYRALIRPLPWLRRLNAMPTLAAVSLALAIIFLSLFLSERQARAARFVQAAVETHERSLQGSLAIQIRSTSGSEITSWFAGRLPFQLRLPAYQDGTGDRSRYQLVGASLTTFDGNRAAYVAYRMGNQLISLMVVSAKQAVATGGKTLKAKSIQFHLEKQNNLQAITWSVHDLTYALVSNADRPERESCIVCHAGPNDRALVHVSRTHELTSPASATCPFVDRPLLTAYVISYLNRSAAVQW